MLRLVMDDEGEIWPDVLHRAPGRGVYLCMRADCLKALSDRHLQKARWKYRVATPRASVLLARLRQALAVLCGRELARLRSRLEVGRDAVLRQLSQPGAVTVFLAAQCGAALRRSVEHAVQARKGETSLLVFPAEGGMSEAVGRGTVAVVSVKACEQVGRLQRYCDWYSLI